MWQSLLEALGTGLAWLYDVVPSYGVAIILLTVAVRVLLLPLTIKQTRSMQGMQKIQPQLKALQQKYKGNRQKLSEETMKLYKEHQVNPLGGCLPLLLQLPVFFALFSVLRATTPVEAAPAAQVSLAEVENAFCRPTQSASATGPGPTEIICEKEGGSTETFQVEGWQTLDQRDIEAPPWVVRCPPLEREGEVRFRCESPVGTGHLPKESELFEDIVEDRAVFLGIHLSCGATQASNEESIRDCAPPGTAAGGAPLVGYYGLIALMVGTTYYQTRQMQQTGPSQQQMRMMGRIMPVFLGFISLSIPAGVLVYWVTTNVWQMGQQHVMLRSRGGEGAPAPGATAAKGDGKTPSKGGSKATGPKAGRSGDGATKQQRGGSRDARGRKKRRKR